MRSSGSPADAARPAPTGRSASRRASRALLSEGEAAEALYREAIERLGRTRLRRELARAHLLYGEWLRREGRRVDAREQLRSRPRALRRDGRWRRSPSAPGASCWPPARRCASAADETRDELTPQEEQIARLARDGLHEPRDRRASSSSARAPSSGTCSKVFTKLGISSRMGLHDALPTATARPRPPGPGLRPGDARARRRARARRLGGMSNDYDVIVLGGGLARRALRRRAGRGRAAGRHRRARAGRRRVLRTGPASRPRRCCGRARRCTARARRRRPRRSTSRRRSPGATSWSPTTPTPGRSAGWRTRGSSCCAAAAGSPGRAWSRSTACATPPTTSCSPPAPIRSSRRSRACASSTASGPTARRPA